MSKRVNRDDIDKLFDHGFYLPKRTIYMGSELVDFEEQSGVDAMLAEKMIKSLLALESVSTEPITILMHNDGGDWDSGMAIYDAIKECKSHVTVKVYGIAASMATVILQAADERIMSPNAEMMIHYGQSGFHGEDKTLARWAKRFKEINKKMERIYLEKIKEKNKNFTLHRLQKLLDRDTFLSAKEAVELGLADKVSAEEESK
jgi:ATP-dependent Clp protease protease subunit